MHIFLKLKFDWLGQTDTQTLAIFSAPILPDITLSFTKGNRFLLQTLVLIIYSVEKEE
jgi:hypothetical protein